MAELPFELIALFLSHLLREIVTRLKKVTPGIDVESHQAISTVEAITQQDDRFNAFDLRFIY